MSKVNKYPAVCILFMLILSACGSTPTPVVTPSAPISQASATPISTLKVPDEPSPTPSSPVPASQLFDIPWNESKVFETNLIPGDMAVLDQIAGATQYRIELNIPEDYQNIIGHEEALYTNRETQTLEDVYFRLFPNINGGGIQVENVRVNGEDAQTTLESANSAMKVALREPLEQGQQALFQLDFSLEIPREMGGNYGLFGYFDQILVLDLFYPAIPVFDENGWYKETPSGNGDLSYYDASFYLVRVKAPLPLVLATSGVEITQTEEGGQQVREYALGPGRDFSIAGSELFTVLSKYQGDTRINIYTSPNGAEGQNLALKAAQNALQIFGKRFGTYDYSEFDVIATPMRAGGVEYAGAVWINQQYFDLNSSTSGTPTSIYLESTVAHEAGHQWFYNAVGNDQFREAWLDEALVQYITGLYYLDVYGSAGFDGVRDSWYSRWNRVDMEQMPIGLPCGEYSDVEYGAIVYGRGPLFMQTLSETMGQANFDAFLKNYYQTYRWQIAQGTDFRQLAESQCNCDLTDLFDTWVYAQ
jgi:hypothetical protein